jgi:diguanylate cyclase (GGDEF)-like protein
MEVSDDAPEILLNPGNDVLNGHIYVTSPLVSCNDDQGKVYWVIHELNKREQSEIATDPLSARTHARRCGAVVFDAAGAILATDSGFHGMTGLDVQAIAALQLSALRSPEHASAPGADDLLTELRHTGQWQGEIGSMGPHRLAYRLWASVSAVHDADGRIVAYAAQFVDREKMLMAERFLLDAHYHDAVTGLPNRKYFKEQVAKRIAAARQDGKHVALLSIMLDRRQWIQDTHDSAVSDAVVMKMGERLLTLTRGCDILARADEDQFLLLLSGPHNDTDLGVIATQMVKALSEPVTIQHQVLQIGGSIGCAMFPQDGPDLPTLTKNAESTMRLARKAGGNRYALFKHRALPAKSDGPDPFNVPTLNMELDA